MPIPVSTVSAIDSMLTCVRVVVATGCSSWNAPTLANGVVIPIEAAVTLSDCRWPRPRSALEVGTEPEELTALRLERKPARQHVVRPLRGAVLRARVLPRERVGFISVG